MLFRADEIHTMYTKKCFIGTIMRTRFSAENMVVSLCPDPIFRSLDYFSLLENWEGTWMCNTKSVPYMFSSFTQ